MTEDELKLAKKSMLEEMKVERGKDESLVEGLRGGLYLGRTYDFAAEMEKKIDAVTVKDVNRALTTHLSTGRLVIVRAGDFKKTQ